MEQKLFIELETLKKELIQQYHLLGMKASGNWEQTLEVSTKADNYTLKGFIFGADYSIYMQRGRTSGKLPPIKAIEQWILHKGIQPIQQKTSITALAWAIAKKIAKQGTIRYQNKGTPPFIDAVITPEKIQQIIDNVGVAYAFNIQANIINLIKNIQK